MRKVSIWGAHSPLWILFEFAPIFNAPSVFNLKLHLENQQIYFEHIRENIINEDNEDPEAVDRLRDDDRPTNSPVEPTSHLLKFFKLNIGELITDPVKLAFTRTLTYDLIPNYLCWLESRKTWSERKKGLITRFQIQSQL